MSDNLFSQFYGGHYGPYGTNEGDIWSAEDSEVGERLKKEKGLILIHEVMERDGEVQECIYSVAQDNPNMEMQMLIKRAREGTIKWAQAHAKLN